MAARKKRAKTKPAAAREIEEIEEVEEVDGPADAATGSGLEMGLIVATTLALLAGIIAGLAELGTHYETGPFAG